MSVHRVSLCCGLIFGLGLVSAGAHAATLRFAGSVSVIRNVTDANAMLGPPDAVTGGFYGPAFEVPGEAVFSAFGNAASYSSPALAGLLGVSEAQLRAADLIVFDINRVPDLQAADGFETSTHTFTDGVGTRVVSHVYQGVSGPEVIAEGRVVASAYDAFFGTTTPPPQGGIFTYGFLLFDLDAAPGDAVDPLSPSFSWRLLGADLSTGTPDVESFGVFVPEPSALLMLIAGFGALAARFRPAAR